MRGTVTATWPLPWRSSWVLFARLSLTLPAVRRTHRMSRRRTTAYMDLPSEVMVFTPIRIGAYCYYGSSSLHFPD